MFVYLIATAHLPQILMSVALVATIVLNTASICLDPTAVVAELGTPWMLTGEAAQVSAHYVHVCTLICTAGGQ